MVQPVIWDHFVHQFYHGAASLRIRSVRFHDDLTQNRASRCGFPLGDAVLLSCSGVVRVDISLQDVDIDQCSSDGWFGGTHRCNATTMEVSSNI